MEKISFSEMDRDVLLGAMIKKVEKIMGWLQNIFLFSMSRQYDRTIEHIVHHKDDKPFE